MMCLQHKHFQSCTRTHSCSHVTTCKQFSVLQWFSVMISSYLLSKLAVVTSVKRTQNLTEVSVFLYYVHIYASTSRWRWKWQHCRKKIKSINWTQTYTPNVWMNRGTYCMTQVLKSTSHLVQLHRGKLQSPAGIGVGFLFCCTQMSDSCSQISINVL